MNWIQIATTVVLVGAALGVLFRAGRWVYLFVHKMTQFLDDWFGEDARPGIAPARPGVLQRISNLEASIASVVQHEAKPNGIEEHVVPTETRPQ